MSCIYKVVESKDGFLWVLSPNGDFNLKLAYNFITLKNTQPIDTSWIWKTLCNQRERFFL